MQGRRLVLIFWMIGHQLLAQGCMPQMSSMRRPGSTRSRKALIYGQHIPNRSELSLSSSGSTEKPILRDTPEFIEKLTENHNMDIIFKDEEGTGADRYMSRRCKDKLDSLAILVMNQWPGVKLRVTESWDEDNAHAFDSLHYEGRAVDITTSDRDKSKLGVLARLAYDAGFDWVYYESRSHIHASVKSDTALLTTSSGCFHSESSVNLEDGSHKTMRELQLGDRVKTISTVDGTIHYSEVFMFLDRNEKQEANFLLIRTVQTSLTVTKSHLIVRPTREDNFKSETVYAELLSTADYLYISKGEKTFLSKIISIEEVQRSGLYAPLTYSGTIVVDNVAASCYAVINSHWVAHWSLWPMRLMHDLQKTLLYTDTVEIEPNIHWYAKWLSYTFTPILTSANFISTL